MAYSARILADSRNPSGHRLMTMEITYPRFVHAEFLTHRLFARNSASNRAIPIDKILKRIEDDPVIPVHWGMNQKGMVADVELPAKDQEDARTVWLDAAECMVGLAEHLRRLGVHKQIVNRLVEPFQWITTIVTGTEPAYANFFHLRLAADAQPELRKIAELMVELYLSHEPAQLRLGDWHLPLIGDEDRHLDIETQKMLSAARCARISTLTQGGGRGLDADVDLFWRLRRAGHWSPLEHVAMAAKADLQSGNFTGWLQYRKCFVGECHTTLPQRG